MTSLKYWVVSAARACALPGCLIVDDDSDDPGAMTLAWTVEGLQEPSDCAFYGIDRLELTVYDIFDDAVVTSYALCEEFELSIRLPEGYYSADATLIDGLDRAAGLDPLGILAPGVNGAPMRPCPPAPSAGGTSPP